MHLCGVVGAGFLHITMIFCLYSGQLPDIPKVEFDYVQLDSVPMPILETCIHSRYCQRFFDQVGHQTMSAYIENKYFFTKSCHRQTHQNYEQPPQTSQNSYFQSHFSALKIG